MPAVNRVVAHFLDGSVVRGTTLDFLPNRPSFHLQPQDGGEVLSIKCNQLKALFFVKDLVGHPERQRMRGFLAAPAETPQGKKVAVRFKDGELLCGYALGYSRERKGFMMFPADTDGNNIRIYVMTEAALAIKAGPEAEELVQKALQNSAA